MLQAAISIVAVKGNTVVNPNGTHSVLIGTHRPIRTVAILFSPYFGRGGYILKTAEGFN